MGLAHAVITCVARDDLADGGAGGFAATIAAIRRRTPRTTIEVLISDCKGDDGVAAHHLRGPSRRAEPQHRDGGPAAAGRPAVCRVRPQPGGAGPGQGGRAHHQVRAHPGHGRTRGRGPGHDGRPPSRRRRHRHHRPVPAAQPAATFRWPGSGPPRSSRRSDGREWPWGSPMCRRPHSPGPATTPARRPKPRSGAAPAGWSRPAPPAWSGPEPRGPDGGAGAPPPVSGGTNGCDRSGPRMGELGVDVLLLSHGADLPWLTGYRAMPLERLTMLVLPVEGDPVLVVPALEAPRVAAAGDLFTVVPWDDTEDPSTRSPPWSGRPRRGRPGAASSAWRCPTGPGPPRCWPSSADCPRPAGWRRRRSPPRSGRSRTPPSSRPCGGPGPAADRVATMLQGGEIDLLGRTEAAGLGPTSGPS